MTYSQSAQFLAELTAGMQRSKAPQSVSRVSNQSSRNGGGLKSIEDFRANPAYGGDNTRIDLAYAVYALAHGSPKSEVEAILRDRDLRHKGTEKRQTQYIERTVLKAIAALSARAR